MSFAYRMSVGSRIQPPVSLGCIPLYTHCIPPLPTHLTGLYGLYGLYTLPNFAIESFAFENLFREFSGTRIQSIQSIQ